MIAVVATLSGVGLAALLGMLGVFLRRALDKLDSVVETVGGHEATDRVLTTNVENLTRELSEFRTKTDDSFTALENKVDQRFDRLGDKIDRALEAKAA